jgi:hypothetical protein
MRSLAVPARAELPGRFDDCLDGRFRLLMGMFIICRGHVRQALVLI